MRIDRVNPPRHSERGQLSPAARHSERGQLPFRAKNLVMAAARSFGPYGNGAALRMTHCHA
jgi:hypothetical protein